jgi:hypothetical protein
VAGWRRYGPFIFAEETIRATNYLDMLQEFVLPHLTQDGVLDTISFQHDGTPPHWALIVLEFLDDTRNNHWCGRDGPIPCPANFPDLTPPDSFVWGICQVTCVRTKTTKWSWSPTEDHRGLCTDHSRHVAQLVHAVWTVPRPPWRSCWVLIC